MKATIQGIQIEGTKEEVLDVIKVLREDGYPGKFTKSFPIGLDWAKMSQEEMDMQMKYQQMYNDLCQEWNKNIRVHN